MTKDKNVITIIPVCATVSMCNPNGTRHTVRPHVEMEEFRRTSVEYMAYWTMHHSETHHFHMGSGRPFTPVCLGRNCGRVLETRTTLVDGPEESFGAGTPVLGWCECLCCKKCVSESPLRQGEWRACPACLYRFAHQETYYMYPVVLGDKAQKASTKK
jgi:hypothetical protein